MRACTMRAYVLVLLLLCAHAASAQEIAAPDNPIPVDATITAYRIVSITWEMEPELRFTINYVDNHGKLYRDLHRGVEEGTDTLMRAINTGNFSSNSLVKRLFQHLMEHNKIPPSTVKGTPAADPLRTPTPSAKPEGPVTPTKK